MSNRTNNDPTRRGVSTSTSTDFDNTDRGYDLLQGNTASGVGTSHHQLNPATAHQYDYHTGTGHGMEGITAETTRQCATCAGINSGKGIHAQQHTGETAFDTGAGTMGVGGVHQMGKLGSEYRHAPDQAHCEKCAALSGGHIQLGTRTGHRQQFGHHHDTETGTGRMAETTTTTTTETSSTTTRSPYNLKPGEQIIEKETRVHTGGAMTDFGTSTTDSRADQTAHDEYAETGVSHVGGQEQKNVRELEHEKGHGKPTIADKILGGMEKAAGKMTSNTKMYQEGQKKASGEFERN